jgi:hypothetical protein
MPLQVPGLTLPLISYADDSALLMGLRGMFSKLHFLWGLHGIVQCSVCKSVHK